MKPHQIFHRRNGRCLLLLLCLTLLTACAHTSSTPLPTDSVETECPIQTEPAITAAENGISHFCLIQPENADNNLELLVKEFQAEWERCTGASAELLKDSKDAGQVAELLIGYTNRTESQTLRDALTAAGGDRYGIFVSEENIAVAGTNTWLTYLGLCRILNSLDIDDAGEVLLSLQPNTTWISDGSDPGMPDIAEATADGTSLVFRMAEIVAEVPCQNGGYRTMQGGGSDGQYAYYGMINGDTDTAYLYKFEIATWTLVAQSEILPLYHTNDITYDAVHHRLVISTCTGKQNEKGICTVDPDTLELLENFEIESLNWAIEYLPDRNEYLTAHNFSFYLTDADFHEIQKIECAHQDYVSQGICYDGQYLYDVRYNNTAHNNGRHYIVVQDLDGHDYGEIPLLKTSMEPENMFRHGSDFYLGLNGNIFQYDVVYRVELLPETFW